MPWLGEGSGAQPFSRCLTQDRLQDEYILHTTYNRPWNYIIRSGPACEEQEVLETTWIAPFPNGAFPSGSDGHGEKRYKFTWKHMDSKTTFPYDASPEVRRS